MLHRTNLIKRSITNRAQLLELCPEALNNVTYSLTKKRDLAALSSDELDTVDVFLGVAYHKTLPPVSADEFWAVLG